MMLDRRVAQRGFSLVEIMVALVIGLFVLAGVGSVYITGKRSYKARDGLSILQENGRVAIKMIEQGVSRAGYPTFAQIEPVIHEASQLDRLRLKNGAPVSSLKIRLSVDGDTLEQGRERKSDILMLDKKTSVKRPVKSDVLTVAYVPVKDGAYQDALDCVGNASEIQGRVISSYFIDNGVLKCQGSAKRSAEPLAEHVEVMQVVYGVDSTGKGFADQYQSASAVAANDWKKVVSIRVALLVSSGTDVLEKAPPAIREFTLAGEKLFVPVNRKIYRVFSTTIPLRNKMPLL